jgi:hypothetical protein
MARYQERTITAPQRGVGVSMFFLQVPRSTWHFLRYTPFRPVEFTSVFCLKKSAVLEIATLKKEVGEAHDNIC